MAKVSPSGNIVVLPFDSIRNISSPEDKSGSRTVYAGHLPLEAIVDLPTHENVRGYLVEAEGKQKRTPTQVHLAIRNTLDETPDMFSILNGGLVIVARDSEIDEKLKQLKILEPSIINGSQTQGVVRDFLKKNTLETPIHVKFELIICEDPGLIAEISIARNFQNDVHSISIAGRRGQLDEIEERIQSDPKFKNLKLQKSETQRPAEGNNYYQTEKLLQVISALLPSELWWKSSEPNRVYTYSQKYQCLKEFQTVYDRAHDPKDEESDRFRKIYEFYLDIAPEALKIYEKWKEHQGFAGTRLLSIERDGRTVKEVPDGIIFPIIAAHCEFVQNTDRGWRIVIPKQLDDKELITAAKSVYQDIARSRPEVMGKTKACYTALQQITNIYQKLLAR